MLNDKLLTPDRDPMGRAIDDYHRTGKASRLRVLSSMFDEDEIPVPLLFRDRGAMSRLEKLAMERAEGRILDVGAGSGCHSLALQADGKDVEAIDISPLSVEVMKERGVRKVWNINLFQDSFVQQYDTVLMLMNGSGIIGRLENFPQFFRKMKQILKDGGEVLLDSSDLRYLYEEEDGSFLIDIAGDYYGEVDFQMVYKDTEGDRFDWLYVDFKTLEYYALENGFKAELIAEGDHYDYLASLHL